MTALFVTAAGTEIGKTLVTTLIARQARESGLKVRALKPVASGFDPEDKNSDTRALLDALDLPASDAYLAATTLYRFPEPISPDMAARRAGRGIDLGALSDFCRPGSEDLLLVEGIGGLMTPLGEKETVLDWLIALDMPALLVVGSYLGTLSHSLTAFEAMKARGKKPLALLVSESAESPVPLQETAEALRRFVAPVPVLGLPRLPIAREPRIWHALAPLLFLENPAGAE